jgi:AcrR family transcriptional regulator
VATRPQRPVLGARYDRRRQEVVESAAREFARHGYNQTSVQQLAERLGIAVGGIYHYFAGKEALLIAICDELTEPLLEGARTLLDDAEQAGATPEAQLRLLVRLWVSQVIDRRNHMLVFQQERHLIEHGDQWKGVRDSRKAFERLTEGVLTRCRLAVDDQRLALSALLGMVNHTAQWYRPRGRLGVDEIADGYVALLLAGTRSRSG